MRRLALAALTALVVVAVSPWAAGAHPLGNFTQNTSLNVLVGESEIAIDYVLDLAEVPALQFIQRVDHDGDRRLDAGESASAAASRCPGLGEGIDLRIAGGLTPLRGRSSELTTPPGQAGLSTVRIVCRFAADVAIDGETSVDVSDRNLLDRAGWREVTAAGNGTTLISSDVPAVSPTGRLTQYPDAASTSPLDVRDAHLEVRPGGATTAAATDAGGTTPTLGRITTSFTDLVSRQQLTVGFTLLAAVIAVVLGAFHALAPGHGKTVMAAYLVSREGTTREALALAATVAITHTIGVLALGVVLTLTESVAPERLYPWLGIASGILFAAVGILLLLRSRSHDPARGHHHGHHHHGHLDDGDAEVGHRHAHVIVPAARRSIGWRGLVAPGLAGGLLPSPSALVVLLGGIALGRTWLGVTLVVAYGIGMSLSLVAAGAVLVRFRNVLARRAPTGPFRGITARLPAITAAVVALGGAVITVRSALVLAG